MVNGLMFVVHGLISMVHGLWSIVYAPWSMVYGRMSMVHGLWAMVHDLWSMVYGPWPMVYGLLFMVHGLMSMVHGQWSMVHILAWSHQTMLSSDSPSGPHCPQWYLKGLQGYSEHTGKWLHFVVSILVTNRCNVITKTVGWIWSI
jgi:hypothetical protein